MNAGGVLMVRSGLNGFIKMKNTITKKEYWVLSQRSRAKVAAVGGGCIQPYQWTVYYQEL